MTENIGKHLTDICDFYVPFYQSEAESDVYPYAVFRHTPQEHSTKEGVYKITSEVSISVYSQDFDEAQAKADAIRAALDADNDPRFLIHFLRQSKQRSEEVWSIELVYYVKQTA
jgi:hypothetical protein